MIKIESRRKEEEREMSEKGKRRKESHEANECKSVKG